MDVDLSSRPWANADNRNIMNKHYKLKGALAEIKRLNREIGRVQAWVDHEDREIASAVETFSHTDPPFASHLERFRLHRLDINNKLRRRLLQISQLPGYSGPTISFHLTDPNRPVAATAAPIGSVQPESGADSGADQHAEASTSDDDGNAQIACRRAYPSGPLHLRATPSSAHIPLLSEYSAF